MSTKALAWAIEQRTGSSARKAVLLLLADLADEQFTCYPGREYLAVRAEMAEGTVSRAITALQADGFLRVLRRARRRGGRTSNRYLLNVYGDATPLPDVDDWVSEFAVTGDVFAGQGNGDADAPLPGDDDETAGHGNGDADAPLPESSNSDRDAHSTVTQTHVSNKEDSYPLGVNKDHSSPPPTVTHPDVDDLSAAALIDIARPVLRHVTEGVEAHRLPTEAERGRLVELTVAALVQGWDPEQLAARLRGMGPLTTVASVYAVLTSRLRAVGPPPPPVAPAHPEPGPWCRSPGCDRTTRRLLDEFDRPMFELVAGRRVALWCPDCSGR